LRRVLVTGASGFVGRHASAALCELGFEVHGATRSVSADEDGGIVWHDTDLRDAAATNDLLREIRASHLLHLAWYTEHGAFWKTPDNLEWAGVTLRLVRAFHACGGQRLVAAGTCAEYAWTGPCCDERTPLQPATLYGAAKDATRRLLEAYAAETGLSFAWGRIFFTFGPGEQPARVVPSVARAALAGEPIACSSGEQVRDFLYVVDVASAFAALIASDVPGSFDIGSGKGTQLREVLQSLERLAGNAGVVRLGEAPERDEPAVIVAADRRLERELGWQPAFTLEEGLRRTLDWWRSRSVT
jgi:nucleoside-diphosphate-sugar epimerase